MMGIQHILMRFGNCSCFGYSKLRLFFKHSVVYLMHWRKRLKTRDALSRLDKRLMQDLGMTPYQLDEEIKKDLRDQR